MWEKPEKENKMKELYWVIALALNSNSPTSTLDYGQLASVAYLNSFLIHSSLFLMYQEIRKRIDSVTLVLVKKPWKFISMASLR